MKIIGAIVVSAAILFAGLMMLGTRGPSFRCVPPDRVPTLSVDATGLPASVGAWKRDQLALAATVLNVASQRGLDEWTAQLGVAVAMKESSLQNLPHGDAVRNDTIGVFQIGPEHGSHAQRMDPVWSAGNFFDRLLKVTGYRDLKPSMAAHRAQRNADPDAYTKMLKEAADVMSALRRSKQPAAGQPSAVAAMPVPAPGTTKRYRIGPVQPVTQQVADRLGASFGIKTIGGWRASTAERWDPEGHPAGLALDFMINDIPDGIQTGSRMVTYLSQHADQIGVKYIIWRQRSWTKARGWKVMADRGSPTQNHMDHVHLSLRRDAAGTLPDIAEGAGRDAPVVANLCQPVDSATAGTAGDNIPVGSLGWTQPIRVRPGSRGFGMRMHPVKHVLKMHEGQDFGAVCGTPLYAASDGVVAFAGRRGGYGHLIILDHGKSAAGSLTTRYGHMYVNGLLVKVGDRVTAGQHIANVGNDGTSTTCHLHFEVRVEGAAIDPIPFLKARGVTW